MNKILTIWMVAMLSITANSQSGTNEEDRSVDTLELMITVENIKISTGQIWIAVYNDADKFLGEDVFTKVVKKVDSTSDLTIPVPGLTPGNYAISVLHDENNNDKMDTGLFGIPKEPYGFSNNVRPKFSAPKYKDAVFQLSTDNQSLNIRIK